MKNVIDNNIENKWRPYEFKWIKHIGSQMIERVRFTIDGQVIQDLQDNICIIWWT